MVINYKNRCAYFNPKTLAFGLINNFEDLHDFSFDQQKVANSTVNGSQTSQAELERLVINISNSCNLNCTYCYAKGGQYAGPNEFIDLFVAKTAINKFYRLYDNIHAIQFFGGEPLLNYKGLEEICKTILLLADKHKKERPVFTIVTNGSILNEKIIDLIRTYDLKVTVSLDGPPEVNDLLRPFKSGKLSSVIIENNIKRMLDQTGQPHQIEGTYTKTHIKQGVTVTDVLNYISSQFSIPILHMPIDVFSEDGESDPSDQEFINSFILDVYGEAVIDSINSLTNFSFGQKTILNSAFSIIEELVTPARTVNRLICPAGTGTLAVDSSGELYPCFMFYRNKEFLLGNSNEDSVLETISSSKFVSEINMNNSSQKYLQSWANRFIKGCAGSNYIKNKNVGTMTKFEISLIESMVSAAIVELSDMKETKRDKLLLLPHLLMLFKAYSNAQT